MYKKIQNEIKEKYYMDNYANDGERFVAWYLRNIFNLDIYQTKECLTDGANDKKIDAVYIDDNEEIIYVIQGKYYNSVIDSKPVEEVITAWENLKNLSILQENSNYKLQSKINEIQKAIEDNYRIEFQLLVSNYLNNDAKNLVEMFSKSLTDDKIFDANVVTVDLDAIKFKYNEALNKERDYINYNFKIDPGKYIELNLNDNKSLIAVISLKECVNIPGIKDGSLFRKNVRHSLGNNNKVNKGMARSIKLFPNDFFFFHNGITAICSDFEIKDNNLFVKELNVVNGCQSLTTINSCGASINDSDTGYILFRFYAINESDKADKISINTNSQTAVKARDLRSNDKKVLLIKKEFEHKYTDGYFVTKRGEKIDKLKYNLEHVVELTDFAKQIISWYSQRPNMAYSETNVFDKYFNTLFKNEYNPENVLALKLIFDKVFSKWEINNPLSLDESLLAMKSYGPYHHFYAVSYIINKINNKQDYMVPNPYKVYKILENENMLNDIVKIAGKCLNNAMKNAVSEANNNSKVFSSQNWIKNKTCLKELRATINNFIDSFEFSNEEFYNKLMKLKLDDNDFEERLSAD